MSVSSLDSKINMRCIATWVWGGLMWQDYRVRGGIKPDYLVSYVEIYRKVLKMVEFCHLDSPSTPSATLSTGSATRLPTP